MREVLMGVHHNNNKKKGEANNNKKRVCWTWGVLCIYVHSGRNTQKCGRAFLALAAPSQKERE